MKLATDTLEQTKKSFHQKYMNDVIEKASHYFNIITKSKYVAIYPPQKNKTFSVETELRTRFTIDQLSQGTIDQLYVALRIAISTVMSEKYSEIGRASCRERVKSMARERVVMTIV